MGATDAPLAVSLGPEAAAEAVHLSREPGWNQCADDWVLMLGHGEGFGYRAPEHPGASAGRTLVASGIALPYADRVGWISMILVTAAWRRRGLASALLERCVAALARLERTPALDATPEGALVYGRHGFEPRFQQRLVGHTKGQLRDDDVLQRIARYVHTLPKAVRPQQHTAGIFLELLQEHFHVARGALEVAFPQSRAVHVHVKAG